MQPETKTPSTTEHARCDRVLVASLLGPGIINRSLCCVLKARYSLDHRGFTVLEDASEETLRNLAHSACIVLSQLDQGEGVDVVNGDRILNLVYIDVVRCVAVR